MNKRITPYDGIRLLVIFAISSFSCAFLQASQSVRALHDNQVELQLLTRHGKPETCTVRAKNKSGLDQDKTPLLDALVTASEQVKVPFFFPGHSMGRGAPPILVEKLLGENADLLAKDLPELPELDNLFAPEGVIREAEALAAEAWGGAARTWFLVNGSSCGIIAALLGCVQRHRFKKQLEQARATVGESIIVLPRNAHKSAIHALVLTGATPLFLSPVYDARFEVFHGVDISTNLASILEDRGADIAAVLLVSPTYCGVLSDVGAAATACHAAGVPLIVDEAHGGHLHFLSTSSLTSFGEHGSGANDGGYIVSGIDETRYAGALMKGADLVVQSTHKTLTSLTQSAVMHLRKGLLTAVDSWSGGFSAERAISAALEVVISSSPSYLLLASLDATRWHMASTGRPGMQLLIEAQRIADTARKEIRMIKGITLLEEQCGPGFYALDPLRLTVGFEEGISGFEADEIITQDFGVYSELPSSKTITFAFGPGCQMRDAEVLVQALRHVGAQLQGRETGPLLAESSIKRGPGLPEQVCTPRSAFFGSFETVSVDKAVGRASAETVCPYPPGIPVLLPGEIITQDTLEYLQRMQQGGASLTGCYDPTLRHIRVLSRRE